MDWLPLTQGAKLTKGPFQLKLKAHDTSLTLETSIQDFFCV